MLVAFLGAPATTKTTVAASIFAQLKSSGIAAEFIAEAARRHIASLRYRHRAQPSAAITLTDSDQLEIMAAQDREEEIFSGSCAGDVIVVTDSSPLNALLYMSAAARASSRCQELVASTLARKPLVFYCPPVSGLYDNPSDGNRVHSLAEAEALDRQLLPLMQEQAPSLKITPLTGMMGARINQALATILTAYTSAIPDDPSVPRYN